MRKWNGTDIHGEKHYKCECNTDLSLEHLMICQSLKQMRELATRKVYQFLHQEDIYHRFLYNIETIHNLIKSYDHLINKFTPQLNLCGDTVKKLRSRDTTTVLNTKDVFNMKHYITLYRQNQKTRAEEYLEKAKKNPNVKTFSTTKEFKILVNHLMAIEYHKICLKLPMKPIDTEK